MSKGMIFKLLIAAAALYVLGAYPKSFAATPAHKAESGTLVISDDGERL